MKTSFRYSGMYYMIIACFVVFNKNILTQKKTYPRSLELLLIKETDNQEGKGMSYNT